MQCARKDNVYSWGGTKWTKAASHGGSVAVVAIAVAHDAVCHVVAADFLQLLLLFDAVRGCCTALLYQIVHIFCNLVIALIAQKSEQMITVAVMLEISPKNFVSVNCVISLTFFL